MPTVLHHLLALILIPSLAAESVTASISFQTSGHQNCLSIGVLPLDGFINQALATRPSSDRLSAPHQWIPELLQEREDYRPSATTVPPRTIQNLFTIWFQGPSHQSSLIEEARRQGFNGYLLIGVDKRPLPGKSAPPEFPEGFDLMSIVYAVAIENIHQHVKGSGIILWRTTSVGCELLTFDYGPGAINRFGQPQEDMLDIFDRSSYTQGSMGHGGRVGIGLKVIGALSYLTRIVSSNGGMVRIVDKDPGFKELKTNDHVKTTQVDFARSALGDPKAGHTGFVVQTFFPTDRQHFRGRYGPVTLDNILGDIKMMEFENQASASERQMLALEHLRSFDLIEVGKRLTDLLTTSVLRALATDRLAPLETLTQQAKFAKLEKTRKVLPELAEHISLLFVILEADASAIAPWLVRLDHVLIDRLAQFQTDTWKAQLLQALFREQNNFLPAGNHLPEAA